MTESLDHPPHQEKTIHQEHVYADTRFVIQNLKTALLVGIFEGAKDRTRCDDYLAELEALSHTYGFEVLDKIACPIKKLDPGTYIGSGKVIELAKLAADIKADVVIFDDEITPKQQKNLEEAFKRPVIDRSELILEVFAKRALTKEARLQIELAKTTYQLPRLKRLWTHLSRQSAGGGAYLKGEGESQIEIDRRLVKKRIQALKEDIKEVSGHRDTQRQARLRSGIPMVAIVGYTNAGKSTLMNALTQADVLVEDKLFATLDTTTRKFTLPNAQEILLIDTVGFIRKIPHALIASFKSTLEETLHTDILLHLIDVSHPLAEEHALATYKVLEELKVDKKPIITVLNKIDLCTNPALINQLRIKYPKTVQVSATQKIGFDDLVALIMKELQELRKRVRLKIPQSHYQLVSELIREGKIDELSYEEDYVLLKVDIPKKLEHKVLPFVIS